VETVDPPGGEFASELAASPLRSVREPLHAGLNALQVAGAGVGTAEPRLLFAALESAQRYLQDEFLPACRAEEATLFGAVDSLLGVANSCHAMKAQHTSIIRMAGDLAQAIEAARANSDADSYAQYLRPLLHGLYALCRVHLESEDEAYIGLLEAVLSSAQVEALAEGYIRAIEEPSA